MNSIHMDQRSLSPIILFLCKTRKEMAQGHGKNVFSTETAPSGTSHILKCGLQSQSTARVFG